MVASDVRLLMVSLIPPFHCRAVYEISFGSARSSFRVVLENKNQNPPSPTLRIVLSTQTPDNHAVESSQLSISPPSTNLRL